MATPATHGTGHRCYVGFDLIKKQVVAIGLHPDRIRDAYILEGTFATDDPTYSRIVLDRDDSWNGREATEIALASQGIGLGWNFEVAR